MTIKPAKLNKVVKNAKSRNANESLLEVNLVYNLDWSKEEYLDRYEGVKSEIVDTTRFDENSDLRTTYLGKINMTWDKDLIVEEKVLISKVGHTIGKLMDRTECQILLDTGGSTSFLYLPDHSFQVILIGHCCDYLYLQILSHLCLSHIIYIAKCYIHYWSLHWKHREFK